jgi:hypothetical protein
MNIKYKDKPEDDLIEEYFGKLEKLLFAHNLTFSVKTFSAPISPMESYINDDLCEKTYLWFQDIIAHIPKKGDVNVHLLEPGIEQKYSDLEVWTNAFIIQDQIYKHFDMVKDDTYWSLWKNPKRLIKD